MWGRLQGMVVWCSVVWEVHSGKQVLPWKQKSVAPIGLLGDYLT